jgi:transcriptional regulator with XRE-family HTH domain
MPAPKMDFAGLPARIKQARVAIKMSRERLGELTGVSRQAVERWEYPVTHPRNSFPGISELHKIAGYLQTDFLWLLTGLHFTQSSAEEVGELRPIWPLPDGTKSGKPLGYKRTSEPVGENAWWFRIEDEDNAPEFAVGEYCLVDPGFRASPGKMIVAELTNRSLNVFRQYTVSGIDRSGNPIIKLRPLNPATPSFSSESEAASGTRSCGTICRQRMGNCVAFIISSNEVSASRELN